MKRLDRETEPGATQLYGAAQAQGNSSAQPPYTVHHPLPTAVRHLDCSPRCRRGRCSTWLRGRVFPVGEGRSRYGGFHRGHLIFRGVGLGRRLSGREGLGAVSLNLQGGLCTSRRCTAGTGMTSTRRAPRRSGIASTPGAAASRARAPTPGLAPLRRFITRRIRIRLTHAMCGNPRRWGNSQPCRGYSGSSFWQRSHGGASGACDKA